MTRHVLAILFGAAFTVATCSALGSLLLRKLRVSLYREEAALFGFLTGAAVVSLSVFLLAAIGQARESVFLVGGATVIAWAAYKRQSSSPAKPLPPAGKVEKYLYLFIITAFLLIYFVNAMAPETSPDGSGYHLGNVARMFRRNGFVWDYHSMYSYLSQGLEMLFLVAYSFGRHSSAALLHFMFLFAVILLVTCYGRRYGFSSAALFAAVMVLASPVVGKSGSSAYNDLAVAALVFGVYYLLQVWNENHFPNFLILIGLFAGFGYAVKYTAALALVFAIGFVWLKSPAADRRRNMAILLSAAAFGILPWIARNWIWVGNPLAPFANRWFPNPYFHPGMEAMYLSDLRQYPGIRHWWEIPWQVLVRGRATAGLLGPVFLLAPLALFGLRHRLGRQLLLAGAIFAVPTWFNTGARFWIPALPFFSLALGVAVARFPAVLAVIAVAHGIAGWPSVISLYADPAAWRMNSIPVSAALRLQPETKYLGAHLVDYSMGRALETLTPPRSKIFSLDSLPEAYLDRTVVVGYESALGNLGMDLLATPLDPNFRPSERQRFPFLPVTTQAIRVVETVAGAGFWTVNEMRIYRQGRELPRSPSWRIKAWPNGWDAPLAFDNSYATRWSSWRSMAYGMFLAVDFGKPEVIDEVVLDHAPAPEAKVQVEVLDGPGHWVPLTDSYRNFPLDTPSGLRRAATSTLRAKGIGYLLVHDTDFFADDMRRYPLYWGVTELRHIEHAALYLIN